MHRVVADPSLLLRSVCVCVCGVCCLCAVCVWCVVQSVDAAGSALFADSSGRPRPPLSFIAASEQHVNDMRQLMLRPPNSSTLSLQHREKIELQLDNTRLRQLLEDRERRETELQQQVEQLTREVNESGVRWADKERLLDFDHQRALMEQIEDGKRKQTELQSANEQLQRSLEANKSLSSKLAAWQKATTELKKDMARNNRNQIKMTRRRDAQQHAIEVMWRAQQVHLLQVRVGAQDERVTELATKLAECEKERDSLREQATSATEELEEMRHDLKEAQKRCELLVQNELAESQEAELEEEPAESEREVSAVDHSSSDSPIMRQLKVQLEKKEQQIQSLTLVLTLRKRTAAGAHIKTKELQLKLRATKGELEMVKQHKHLEEGLIDTLNQQLAELREDKELWTRENLALLDSQNEAAAQLAVAEQKEAQFQSFMDELTTLKRDNRQLQRNSDCERHIHDKQTDALQARIQALEQQLSKVQPEQQLEAFIHQHIEEAKEAEKADSVDSADSADEQLISMSPCVGVPDDAASLTRLTSTRSTVSEVTSGVFRAAAELLATTPHPPLHDDESVAASMRSETEWPPIRVCPPITVPSRWSGRKRQLLEVNNHNGEEEEDDSEDEQPLALRRLRSRRL